jgi:hypothetical protein
LSLEFVRIMAQFLLDLEHVPMNLVLGLCSEEFWLTQ